MFEGGLPGFCIALSKLDSTKGSIIDITSIT